MAKLCLIPICALAWGLVSAAAGEKSLPRAALPAAVAATIDAQSQGATVHRYLIEREHGQTVYEAETMLDGHSRDLEVAADGTLNEVEEEVAFSMLPLPVQQALARRAGRAVITKVESLRKHDRIVAYEAATLHFGRKGEIQVDPDGNKLAHDE